MAWIEKRTAPKAPQGATWRVCDRGTDAHPFVVQSGFPRWADADEFLKKFEGRKVQGKTKIQYCRLGSFEMLLT